MKELKPYPAWCCYDCGVKARGKPLPEWSIATYHDAICPVCGKEAAVTEPRDFGYPKFEGHKP